MLFIVCAESMAGGSWAGELALAGESRTVSLAGESFAGESQSANGTARGQSHAGYQWFGESQAGQSYFGCSIDARDR